MKKIPLTALLGSLLALPAWADSAVHECVVVEAVDGSFHYNSNISECGHPTAPASTFKIPHALIALDAGVIADPLQQVEWDGKEYPNASWQQDHSMDSAIRWSVLWFFQRTAALLGNERMLIGLLKLQYAKDSFDGALHEFWLNADLVVTPQEQVVFLRHLAASELPVKQAHMDAVKNAMRMPPGKVTLAAGEHPLLLNIADLREVYAKTGNASVDGEYVSWLVGYVVADKTYVFASRVRAGERLAPTAGAALAQAVLNEKLPSHQR